MAMLGKQSVLCKWKAATATGYVSKPRRHGAPPPDSTTGGVLQGNRASSLGQLSSTKLEMSTSTRVCSSQSTTHVVEAAAVHDACG
jgi:hypothetical protein